MSNDKRRNIERDKYEALHRKRGYSGFDANHGSPVYNLIDALDFTTLLDLGSGSGAFARRFRERGKTVSAVDISEYALTNPNYEGIQTFCRSLDDLSGVAPHQVVTSFDCFEHLHPKMVPDALRHLARVTEKYAFLNICYDVSQEKGTNGEELHLTIKGEKWWIEKLRRAYGPSVHIRPKGDFLIITRS